MLGSEDYYNNRNSSYSGDIFQAPPVNYQQFSSNDLIFQNFNRDVDEPVVQNQNVNFGHLEDQGENIAASKGATTIRLLDGQHFSFDYPVPKQLLEKIPFDEAKQLTEFSHLRYHAITCDPKDYDSGDGIKRAEIENYPLRPKLYAETRETELMIVCTMYNEDEVLLGRTLKGVFKNIKHMYNLPDDESDIHPFGREAWKKIVVVIVSDGRSKIHERSKALLSLLGCFQEGIMQEKVNDQDVNAHLFEYTTSFGIGKLDFHRHNEEKGYTVPLVTEQTVPVQMMFLLKEQNKQKINSHRWAFNFLCPNLKPKVVCLLDVGTEPGPDSIYKLYEAFKDKRVGGACGEIRTMLGSRSSPNDDKSNPLVAAQNFEYKISNILDKPMESAFGFVTVLPGAFSAYRYSALHGAPLKAYFHGEDMKSNTDKPAGVLESNMYLAEDRILCFELVAKSTGGMLLRYVHDAFAVTDVPSTVNEFINQRRRWLNGSFFAALYSIIHFYRIGKANYSFFRTVFLYLEILYQTVNIGLSWLSISFYFLVFRVLTLGVADSDLGFDAGNILAVIFLWIYMLALALTFVISFGNKPNDAKRLYIAAFSLFSVVMCYMIVCVVLQTISSIESIKDDISSDTHVTVLTYLKNSRFRDLTVALGSTYVLYFFGSLLFFDFFHLVTCTLQYLLLSPAYINVLTIFAFCNIHDISWGTKGSLTVAPGAAKKEANTTGDSNELVLSEALQDPDEIYLIAQKEISKPEAKEKQDVIKTSERNYATGRTYTVLLWLISNFIIIVVVLRTGGLDDYKDIKSDSSDSSSSYDTTTANRFMAFILWAVAVLSLFRFIGAIVYRIHTLINRRRNHKKLVER
ncbi:glycosyltransferase family 2 protein [[Candida] arabinofermentans NRRL YB-2248]|uniref:Chitin synthase n=1 Tax=[Candida] arabinofermentans NRRL YB-2248 TaxID=983967 RepID=A0A1E4SXW0_9ASCO|nr:glycosyltransferase family 2 protein [[Candida] arabinofermentans NRRL YB-2248]